MTFMNEFAFFSLCWARQVASPLHVCVCVICCSYQHFSFQNRVGNRDRDREIRRQRERGREMCGTSSTCEADTVVTCPDPVPVVCEYHGEDPAHQKPLSGRHKSDLCVQIVASARAQSVEEEAWPTPCSVCGNVICEFLLKSFASRRIPAMPCNLATWNGNQQLFSS